MCGLYVLRVGIPIRLVCDGSRPETVPWYRMAALARPAASRGGVRCCRDETPCETPLRAHALPVTCYFRYYLILLFSLCRVTHSSHAHTLSRTHRPETADTHSDSHNSVSSHTQSPHDSKTTAAWQQIKPQVSQPRVRGWRRPTVADGRIGRPPWSTRRAPRRPSTGTPVTTGSHDRGSTEEMSGRGNTHSPCATHEAARGSSC